jgi:hypothetical protein
MLTEIMHSAALRNQPAPGIRRFPDHLPSMVRLVLDLFGPTPYTSAVPEMDTIFNPRAVA